MNDVYTECTLSSMQKLFAEIKSRNSSRKAKTFYLLLIDGARMNMLQRQKKIDWRNGDGNLKDAHVTTCIQVPAQAHPQPI